MAFKDHFSKQADEYAKYRPLYPTGLFEWLACGVPRHDRAWDCGTGSGQAALGLAQYFVHVVATDPSARQISRAVAHPRISYAVGAAERSGLAACSVDLIAVAQALHWLDFDPFYREAARVLRPDGMLAAWTYGLARIAPEVDRVTDRYYRDILGRYWSPERSFVDEQYRTIPFPLTEIKAPALRMQVYWTFPEFVGYLGTWSAARRFAEAHGRDPLEAVRKAFVDAWGPEVGTRRVQWPLYLRAGRFAE